MFDDHPLMKEALPEERAPLAEAIHHRTLCMDRVIKEIEANRPDPPVEMHDSSAPFARGSRAWGFYVLLFYKPHRALHSGEQPLLPPVESPIDQCIRDKLICAKCFAAGSRMHQLRLQPCTRCQSVAYCNTECERIAWTDHKITCTTSCSIV